VRGHADAETLAAFREGLLSRRKAGQVSAHLAGCPRCAALDAQLAEVTVLLTRSAAPPMPDALTARIEAALAAEAAARSAAAPAAVAAGGAGPAARDMAGRGAAPGGAGRGADRRGRGRSGLVLRVAAVAAAVAVIAGGGYGVLRLLSPGRASETSAGLGAEGAPRAPGATRPALPGMSGGVGAPAGGTVHAPAIGTAIGQVVSSGTNYQPGRLGAQASTVLAQLGPAAHASPAPSRSRAAPQNHLATAFPALPACVARVARGQRPLLVDVARYQGHPAAVIVLRAAPGGRPRAVVVAPGCSGTTARVLATAALPGSG
jgi:hypothetical protein